MKRSFYFSAVASLLAKNADAATMTLKGAAAPAAIVPTLNEWGMIILASLFVLFGIQMMRKEHDRIGIAVVGAGILAMPLLFGIA